MKYASALHNKSLLLLCVFFVVNSLFIHSQKASKEWIKENYTKDEVLIPMRDGVKLYTAIYQPIKPDNTNPIIIYRTPYSCSPYGEEYSNRLKGLKQYLDQSYVIVIQDVRGRYMSEGDFVNMRPFNPKKKATDIDESTDSYDTVDWLINNIPNNGCVGFSGNSYSGFYAWMAALSNHPTIKAVCPQAPAIDWYMGDDIHHNGILMMGDAFRFLPDMDIPRDKPSKSYSKRNTYYHGNEYDFFLEKKSIANLTQFLGDSLKFWNNMVKHPDYDKWWQDHNSLNYAKNVKPAVFCVGGLFDAEDLYGSWELFKAIDKKSPATSLYFLMGPWSHGEWNWGCGKRLGDWEFGSDCTTSIFHSLEKDIFKRYLNSDTSIEEPAKVTMFFTGSNQWRNFECWPPKQSFEVNLYLNQNGKLSSSLPKIKQSQTSYFSDTNNPVPYKDNISSDRGADYMAADQSFTSNREDVLVFSTDSLINDLTVAGAVEIKLFASASTTDADFFVKVIDVDPNDGKQRLVRSGCMRARYRDGFTNPKPLKPNKIDEITLTLNDIAHTFLKDHKLMIHIQSSCFPLYEMSPQQFINTYECSPSDFVSSQISIYHQKKNASYISLPVLN